jgi:hypothetical protein
VRPRRAESSPSTRHYYRLKLGTTGLASGVFAEARVDFLVAPAAGVRKESDST